MNPLCSLIGYSWPSLLSNWLQVSEDHLSDLVSEQTGRSRWQDSGWKIQTGGLFPWIQQLPSPSRMYKYTQRYAHMYKYTITHILTSVCVSSCSRCWWRPQSNQSQVLHQRWVSGKNMMMMMMMPTSLSLLLLLSDLSQYIYIFTILPKRTGLQKKMLTIIMLTIIIMIITIIAIIPTIVNRISVCR